MGKYKKMDAQLIGGGVLFLGIIGFLLAMIERANPASASIPPAGAGVGNSASKDGTNILSYPKDRRLNEHEVYELADYMKKLGLNVDQFYMISIAWIESSWQPWVERFEPRLNDYSTGLMQTLLSTAKDLYSKGYKAFGSPTREALKNPAISMYFGCAYFDWLKKSYPNHNIEWYVRAYNGGPGNAERVSTQPYFDKFKVAVAQYGGLSAVSFTVGG